MVNDIVYTFSEPVTILDPSVDANVFTIAVASSWTGTVQVLSWTAVAGSGTVGQISTIGSRTREKVTLGQAPREESRQPTSPGTPLSLTRCRGACVRSVRHFGQGIGPALKATILTEPRISHCTTLPKRKRGVRFLLSSLTRSRTCTGTAY
jgi:hypothetical protein